MISLVRKSLFLISIFILVPGPFFFPFQRPCSQGAFAGESEEGLSIPEKRLDQILLTTEKNLGRIKTLKTRLIQEKNLALFSEPVLSRGILLFKKPGKIRLEFFEPFQSILVVSGNTISKFEAFNGEWKKMDSGNEKIMGIILDHIAAWISGRFNQGNLYRVSGKYRPDGKGEAFSLILEPRAEEFRQFIRAFELGINSGMDRLDYIVIRESGDDYTRINFHEDRINYSIKDIYFDGSRQPLPPVPQW